MYTALATFIFNFFNSGFIIISGLGWSYPCDMWSVGCILVELCSVSLLFFFLFHFTCYEPITYLLI